jgi:hypothetical protein
MRLTSFIKIATCTAVAVAVALAVGLLRPGLTLATLQRHAEEGIARCVHDAGFADAAAQARPAGQRALEGCWSAAARNPRFERLGLVDPIAYTKQARIKGFAAWRCVERAGYVRTTGIPLSDPGAYPLRVAAGNFRVGPTDADLARFYRAAAQCTGEALATFRWSDGTFSREPADGTTRCIHHRDGNGPMHSHGCLTAGSVPDSPGGSHR